MADSMLEIKARVEAERRKKLAEERAAEGIEVQPEELIPPEWALDVQKSTDALLAIMGGTVVSGTFDPVTGSFTGLELQVKGEKMQITFNLSDTGLDGDWPVRVLPAIFDSKPVPLPANLVERQRQLQAQQGQGPLPGR